MIMPFRRQGPLGDRIEAERQQQGEGQPHHGRHRRLADAGHEKDEGADASKD
jgi:hypothetical protein